MAEATILSKIILTDDWRGEISQVVGEIAISFAQLEHVLWLSPKRIKKLPFSVWEQMAGRVSITERCAQIRDSYAVRAMHQDKEASLDSLLKSVVRVNEQRNAIIHGRWGCKKDGGVIVSRHRIWKGKEQRLDKTWFIELRGEIRELRRSLGKFSW